MQRVTRSTAAVALPAPPAGAGSPGYFTGGDPGTGAPATVPGYEWFNGVQEELMYVIEQAGLSGSATVHTKLRQAIQSMVSAGAVPVGAIVPFAATAAPSGWIKLNGALLSRTTYAALYAHAVAGGNMVSDPTWLAGRPGSFSSGDGSTTFRILDMRGLFMRGYHDGSGTYESDTGVALGAYRDSQNVLHGHPYRSGATGVASPDGAGGFTRDGNETTSYAAHTGAASATTGQQIGGSGGAEGYPRHVPLLFCIKY